MSIRELIKSRISKEDRRRMRQLINAAKWPVVKPLGVWRARGLESRLPYPGGRRWRREIGFELLQTSQAGTIG
jgi:hypothetical protein